MNFLITGGSGFIGKSLVIKLSKIKNSKITVIDKKNYNFNKKNIFFVKIDLNNKKVVKKIKNNFDYIFHLAADLGVKKVINFPLKSCENNINTCQNIIQVAKNQKKLKRFFYFSTSEIYSQLNTYGKMSENDKIQMPTIYHPRTSYWLSKITGEFLTISSKLPYTIFRIFNVYGPNMKSTHVIPSIFEKLNKKNPLFENPTHSRCFMYVDDAVNIFVISLKSQFKNQILNVANPNESIKVKSLVRKIQKLLNNHKKIKYKSIKNLSIVRRKPSIKKLEFIIKNKIKFTTLSQGLEFMKQSYENKNWK